MSDPQPRRVLVVEDSVLIALAIEAALEDRGLAVVVVGSLAAAEQRLADFRPAAAILDLQLPDGNSLRLARRLHDGGCPVAICSGVDSGMIPPALNFARCFQKPIAADALAQWAAHAMEGAAD